MLLSTVIVVRLKCIFNIDIVLLQELEGMFNESTNLFIVVSLLREEFNFSSTFILVTIIYNYFIQ